MLLQQAMASLQEHRNIFAPLKQLPNWSQMDQPSVGTPSGPARASFMPPEPLRPIEPGDSQNTRRPYLHSRPRGDSQNPQRQQLPGVHELLSPSVRIGARSPAPGSWAPINNPSIWHDRLPHPNGGLVPGISVPRIGSTAINSAQAPLYRQMEMPVPEGHRQGNSSLPATTTSQHPSLLPVLPLRQMELSSPVSHGRQELPGPSGDYFSSPSYQNMSGLPHDDARRESIFERRPSSALTGKTNASGGVLSLQIVGQRDIPGEGLCYVFKDGSTCPTIIDGEPVNPLWGTTKAGKARKRLAQACLNCREKKIKCEPGEMSCLQCEKAKRECQRPSASQTQAEMAAGAALAMSNNTSGNGDWVSQSSPRSTSTSDLPAPKRRRSAHVAQQESVAFEQSSVSADSPPSSHGEPKRQRSEQLSINEIKAPSDRQRKDSKRVQTDDEQLSPTLNHVGISDAMIECEDPYRVEPHGTMLFLDLFFAQCTRESVMLFPRQAFTRWVKGCKAKCQREIMVLYSVLALGSAFSSDQFSLFARVCTETATRVTSNLYGRFSLPVIQARLLLGAYNDLKGKEGLAWDYNGSALRAIGAMKLNTEEGCGDGLDEYARPLFSFSLEQLRECRRRTFWSAFLMDRYNGFCSGLLNTINEEDVHIRLPCAEQTYEDGLSSTAPFFEGSASSMTTSSLQSPATYTVHVSILWKEVVQFTYRSAHQASSTYSRKYEYFLNSIQRRLSDWTYGLPQYLKYSRENLELALNRDYAGDFVSMHILHLSSHLQAARMIRHELLPENIVARSICVAHSHALQLLALLRDIRGLTLASPNNNRRTTDFMSPFISYAVCSAIDTLGAGGLREEVVATKQVLSTAIEILRDLSRHCNRARAQLRKAEKRLAQIEAWPPEMDIRAMDVRAGRNAESLCWRITEPMEKAMSLQQDVMYGVSSSTFAEALTEGRRQ